MNSNPISTYITPLSMKTTRSKAMPEEEAISKPTSQMKPEPSQKPAREAFTQPPSLKQTRTI